MFDFSLDPSLAQASHAGSDPAPPSVATSGEVSYPAPARDTVQQFGLAQFDFCCFHTPFHKLVRKAFARLWHIDNLRQHSSGTGTGTGTGEAHPASLHQEAHADTHQAQVNSLQQSPSQQSCSQRHLNQHPQQRQMPSSQQSQSQPAAQQLPQLQAVAMCQQQSQPQLQAAQLHRQQQAEANELQHQLAAAPPQRGLEKQWAAESSAAFEAKVEPGCLAGREVGNTYSGWLHDAYG